MFACGAYSAAAAAATIAISPHSGNVGTKVHFHGTARECKHYGSRANAEVFFQIGNFAGNSDVNPRLKIKTGRRGAFSGVMRAPNPFRSADPRAPRMGMKKYAVSVRCIGRRGEHNSGQIVDRPPMFTYKRL
jgi:hypothetical protein